MGLIDEMILEEARRRGVFHAEPSKNGVVLQGRTIIDWLNSLDIGVKFGRHHSAWICSIGLRDGVINPHSYTAVYTDRAVITVTTFVERTYTPMLFHEAQYDMRDPNFRIEDMIDDIVAHCRRTSSFPRRVVAALWGLGRRIYHMCAQRGPRHHA